MSSCPSWSFPSTTDFRFPADGVGPGDERSGLNPMKPIAWRLTELADAMLVWAEGREVERLIDDGVERIWTDELAAEIRDGLLRVAADEEENWLAAACYALRGSSTVVRLLSEVAVQLSSGFATELAQNDHPPFFCACCLDAAVAAAPREARRSLALQMATVARRRR